MKWIDLRSDTVTKPTEKMRLAMANAEVGDDVYQDDPTVIKLEQLAATLLEKEAALFVTSGTMGNQLSIMTHTNRGDEIIIAKHSHIIQYEVGAAAVLSGVSYSMVENPDDQIYPDDIERLVRGDNIHHPKTSLVCLENALSNGTVVSLENMQKTITAAHQAGCKVHVDGARIFNAAVALNVPAAKLVEHADSVMFCLSKGLGAPIGSIVVGSKEFIEKLRKNRKLVGGGWRQAGIIAAAGIVALEEMIDRLIEDHQLADYCVGKLKSIESLIINEKRRDINMVFFKFTDQVNDDDFVAFLNTHQIKINPKSHGWYRIITHVGIVQSDIDKFIDAVKLFIN